MFSMDDDDRRLEAMEDAWWAARADAAMARADWAGVEESERALKDIMNVDG